MSLNESIVEAAAFEWFRELRPMRLENPAPSPPCATRVGRSC